MWYPFGLKFEDVFIVDQYVGKLQRKTRKVDNNVGINGTWNDEYSWKERRRRSRFKRLDSCEVLILMFTINKIITITMKKNKSSKKKKPFDFSIYFPYLSSHEESSTRQPSSETIRGKKIRYSSTSTSKVEKVSKKNLIQTYLPTQ